MAAERAGVGGAQRRADATDETMEAEKMVFSV